MNHGFDIEHAVKYGIEEAIMLGNLIHWVVNNRANGTNFHQGRTWTYNSVRAYCEQYPYMKRGAIDRTLKSLVTQGVVITGMFNARATDRTLWYALANEDAFLPVLSDFPKTGNANDVIGKSTPQESGDAFPENGKSLISTDVNTHKNTDSRRGSRLPTDWVLTRGWAKVALEIWENWTPEHTRFEADKFRDHWHSQSGSRAVKRDWLATWRNWVRTAGAMKAERAGSGGAWWASDATALIKAEEVGVGKPHNGESTNAWHARIRAAIDNGGKPPAPRPVPVTPLDPVPSPDEPRTGPSDASRAAMAGMKALVGSKLVPPAASA